eukprot:5515008-Alexandrium_andersonii.AAC.1
MPQASGGAGCPSQRRAWAGKFARCSTRASCAAWHKARAWLQPIGTTANRGHTRAARGAPGRPGSCKPRRSAATGGSAKKGLRTSGREST